MMRAAVFALAFAGVVLAGPSWAAGPPYDPATAFANANPNGPWSYDYTTSASPVGLAPLGVYKSVSAPSYLGGGTLNDWQVNNGSTLNIGVVTGGSNSNFNGAIVLTPNIPENTYPGSRAAALVFSAPEAGVYDLTGPETIDAVNIGAPGTGNNLSVVSAVVVDIGGVKSIYQKTLTQSSPTTTFSQLVLSTDPTKTLPSTFDLGPGDKLAFITSGNTGDPTTGGVNTGNTAWKFQISTVPESSTWVLMMAGVGGVGTALRRREKGNGAAARTA
jgi:hypothetical protein